MAEATKTFGIRADEELFEEARAAKDEMKGLLGPAATDADVLREWIRLASERTGERDRPEIASAVAAVRRAQDVIASSVQAMSEMFAAQADMAEEAFRGRLEMAQRRALSAEEGLAAAEGELAARAARITALEGELGELRDELARRDAERGRLERVEEMLAGLVASRGADAGDSA